MPGDLAPRYKRGVARGPVQNRCRIVFEIKVKKQWNS